MKNSLFENHFRANLKETLLKRETLVLGEEELVII